MRLVVGTGAAASSVSDAVVPFVPSQARKEHQLDVPCCQTGLRHCSVLLRSNMKRFHHSPSKKGKFNANAMG